MGWQGRVRIEKKLGRNQGVRVYPRSKPMTLCESLAGPTIKRPCWQSMQSHWYIMCEGLLVMIQQVQGSSTRGAGTPAAPRQVCGAAVLARLSGKAPEVVASRLPAPVARSPSTRRSCLPARKGRRDHARWGWGGSVTAGAHRKPHMLSRPTGPPLSAKRLNRATEAVSF